MAHLAARALTVATLLLAPTLTGCGGSGAKPKPASTPTVASPTPTPSATDPIADASRKAEAAYRGMWKAYVAATHEANPDSPDLARYTDAEALERITVGLRKNRAEGILGRGDVVLHPSVGAFEPLNAPIKATVTDCVNTAATSLYKADGSNYQDTPGGPRLAIATVKDVGGGVWKVTGIGLREVGTCSP